MGIADWLDARRCPEQPPGIAEMGSDTRVLHEGLDHHARRTGQRWLHPTSRTVQRDLLGSADIVAWQEAKSGHHFLQDGCWSELPQLYGRYGSEATGELTRRVKALEGGAAALLTDCGMASVALVFDSLMEPGAHAVLFRQVYNKSRAYLERLVLRMGCSLSLVDDGDLDAFAAAIRPETRLVFCETFTNPLTRAQDPRRIGEIARERGSSELRVVIDDTIATPWGPRAPLLSHRGVDVVVGSGTKALCGQDTDMFGYVVTDDIPLANKLMDLAAMRGGILDWRRATALVEALPRAKERWSVRCRSARKISAFLQTHPRVEQVWHPSLSDHPDAEVIAEHYRDFGSLLSFRVLDSDEDATRRVADAIASCAAIRYALSFDGLATKVNHHQSVSEYFTPPPVLRRLGFDRLIRLGIGLEEADDLVAVLNWALWHGARLSDAELAARRHQRVAALSRRGS